MKIGMLWFDNDPKSNLDTKIERAVVYYQGKYGRSPTLCFVHPSMINGASKTGDPKQDLPHVEKDGRETGGSEKRFAACGVEVRPNQSVLPNHFWIGVNGS